MCVSYETRTTTVLGDDDARGNFLLGVGGDANRLLLVDCNVAMLHQYHRVLLHRVLELMQQTDAVVAAGRP